MRFDHARQVFNLNDSFHVEERLPKVFDH